MLEASFYIGSSESNVWQFGPKLPNVGPPALPTANLPASSCSLLQLAFACPPALPTANNCQLACVLLQLAFVLRGSSQGTPSQGVNTMAVNDGSGPWPAPQTAKRCFLNCLYTSFKPCTAGQGTPSQGLNTMSVKDGSGPWPAPQTAKRCFLNCL